MIKYKYLYKHFYLLTYITWASNESSRRFHNDWLILASQFYVYFVKSSWTFILRSADSCRTQHQHRMDFWSESGIQNDIVNIWWHRDHSWMTDAFKHNLDLNSWVTEALFLSFCKWFLKEKKKEYWIILPKNGLLLPQPLPCNWYYIFLFIYNYFYELCCLFTENSMLTYNFRSNGHWTPDTPLSRTQKSNNK